MYKRLITVYSKPPNPQISRISFIFPHFLFSFPSLHFYSLKKTVRARFLSFLFTTIRSNPRFSRESERKKKCRGRSSHCRSDNAGTRLGWNSGNSFAWSTVSAKMAFSKILPLRSLHLVLKICVIRLISRLIQILMVLFRLGMFGC